MTEVASKNGTKKPETGERGFSSEADDLFGEGHFPYSVDEPKPGDFDEMFDDDSQAHALERGVALPILGAPYEIEDAEGGAKEGEFVRDVLLKPIHEGGMTTPVENIIAQMVGAFSRKLAFFEIVWELKDAKYVIRKLAHRPAATCRIKKDDNGSFDGFIQEGFKNGKPVKETFGVGKAFVYVHRGGERPLEGRSSFSSVYRRYKHKKRVEWLFFDNLQTFTRGIRKVTYGGDEGTAGAKALFDRVKTVQGAGTVVLGKDDDLDVLRAPGVSTEYKEALNYLDSQMARALLAQWLNLGTDGKTGSWALSRDHSDFFLQAMESVLNEISWHVNNYLIPLLVKYNFGENAKSPKWVFQPLSETTRNLALEVFREFATAAQPNVKPAFMAALEEKAAQAVEIDPEKLEEDEEDEAHEPAEDVAPAPEGLQRAIGALQQIAGANGNGNAPAANGAPALEEDLDEYTVEAEDEDGNVVELHLPGKHVQKTHGSWSATNAFTPKRIRKKRKLPGQKPGAARGEEGKVRRIKGGKYDNANPKLREDEERIAKGVKQGVKQLDNSRDMDDWDIIIREDLEMEPFTGDGWARGDDMLSRLAKAYPQIRSAKQFDRSAGRKDHEDSALGYNIPTDRTRSTEDRSELFGELAQNWNKYIYGDKKRRGSWESRPDN